MKYMRIVLLFISIAAASASPAHCDSLLWDFMFNLNGDTYAYSEMQGNVDDFLPDFFNFTAFNWNTGIGTITINYNPATAGDYFFTAFFDHEIDQNINYVLNEYGVVNGAPAAGQSYEIDEPGYSFGDIYANAMNGSLDNTNGIPSGMGEDVSMAMGYNFHLADDQWAFITLVLGEETPTGFYLAQVDSNSANSLYFSGALDIQGGSTPAPVPEPATMTLFGVGLLGLSVASRKKIRKG